MKKIDKLLKLIKENPYLPIVPMVDGEIAGDDYSYYVGKWGDSCIDEYFIELGHIFFKSDDDMYEVLEYIEDDIPESDEECRKLYENLPWKKAIIVYIRRP